MDKFFIVGCPRSGTTMVQQALNRHSQVLIPPETKFFFSFYGHSRRQQARHINRLNADLGIHLPTPTQSVCSPDEGRAYYEDMAQQYVERQQKSGVVYFGEKTPEHTGRLPHIRELFPDAKVLVLYRDGRDVASSLTRVPWMSSNLYVNFLVWLYYSWVVREERKNAGPNLYFARYEDIVASPETEMRGVLDFLGLDYEPAVAEGWGNREGIPSRELAWKSRALQPITQARVGTFRRELSDEQIEYLERLGREALPSFGYSLLGDGKRALSASFLMSLGYHLSRLAYRLPWGPLVKELFCRLFLSSPVEPALSPTWLASPRPGRTPAESWA